MRADPAVRLLRQTSHKELSNDQTCNTLGVWPRRHLRTEVADAEEHLVSELETELARVKADLDAAGQQEQNFNQEDEAAADELEQAEAQVRALRSQMDQLTQEIKQANLQSLSIAPADDLKILLEGECWLLSLYIRHYPARSSLMPAALNGFK